MPPDVTPAVAFRLFVLAATAGLVGLVSLAGLLVLWLTRKPPDDGPQRGAGR